MKKILFEDLIKVPYPELTKVKFNINANDADTKNKKRATYAWDNLKDNENDSLEDPWIIMNAHKEIHANNNLNKAKYLLAFAQYYPYGREYYIFGGYYKVDMITPEVFGTTGYKLTLLPEFSEYRKRLIIKLQNKIGQSYSRVYNNMIASLMPEVYEIAPNKKLQDFPGYNNVLLTNRELNIIFKNDEPTWKEALSYVKGIYCITNKVDGKLYIGSAYGNGGIWQRWQCYADGNNLTGGNKAFDETIKISGRDYIENNFTYSILEIFDMKTKDSDIIQRESYWKKVFKTIEHGMNYN